MSSYLAKKNKNVLLLSTFHARDGVLARGDDDDGGDNDNNNNHNNDNNNKIIKNKPVVVWEYNANKDGVDNLDKVVGAYSCRRMTARWSLAIFHNILDVYSYNTFVIWRELNPGWFPGRRNKRRVFLEQLGKALVAPLVEWRPRLPSAEAAAAVVKAHWPAAAVVGVGGDSGCDGGGAGVAAPPTPHPPPPLHHHHHPPPPTAEPPVPASAGRVIESPVPAGKRKRCQVCPSKDCKTRKVCRGCRKYICGG